MVISMIKLSDISPTPIILELPINKIDISVSGKVKDNCLKALSKSRLCKFLPQQSLDKANELVKGFKNARNKAERSAIISGGLAGTANLVSMIPLVGGIISTPISFAANHQGFTDGIKVGDQFTKVRNERAELINLSKIFYNDLARRLLVRHANALQTNLAEKLEQKFKFDGKILSQKRIQKLDKSQKRVKQLAAKILLNLEKMISPAM